jgi:4-hydroxybenzoate polyprenyltransferase
MQAIASKKIVAVSELIRLKRQYGTLLVLSPTLWSLFMATDARPPLKLLIVFVLGAFLMRSAGCAINDIADRDIDSLVERTRTRPLPAGLLSAREALFVFMCLSLLAFALALLLNPLTILLSVAGVCLAVTYPFVKRFSYLPQAFLGIAFGWGAVMAWSAAKNEVALTALLIFLANVLWSTAYDTIYALQDIEDDLRAGVKSSAILFGRRVYTALAMLYVAMAFFLCLAGYSKGMGLVYYAGVGLSLSLFLLIVNSLRKSPSRDSAFKGFVQNAYIGMGLLVFIIAGVRY